MPNTFLSLDKKVFARLASLTLLVSAFWLTGCSGVFEREIQNAQYKLYELVGIQKRDLLDRKINDVREEQKETQETFKSALDKMKAITNFDGGNLEHEYRSLQSSYDQAQSQAQDVRKSIRQVETVANDMFKEWDNETKSIKSPAMRTASRRKLAVAKRSYEELHANLVRSEKRMDPVLDKFNDQVLYLKHNLNAQAVTSLRGEADRIEGEIQKLMADMDRSIASADRFAATIPHH
jgi:hypothetical protein